MLALMPTDEEWSDANHLADEMAGHPLPRSAEEGVRDMTVRLKVLEERLVQCRAHLAAGADPVGFAEEEIKLLRELQEAKQRLAEYQAQLGGRN